MENKWINRLSLVFSITMLSFLSSCDLDQQDQSPELLNQNLLSMKPRMEAPSDFIPDNTNARENWTQGEGWAKGFNIPLTFDGLFLSGSEIHSYMATIKAGALEGSFEVENFDEDGNPTVSVKGEVTCMVFEDDCQNVRMTGIITEATNEDFVGTYAVWIATDNDQAQDETTDIRYGLSQASANFHCAIGFRKGQFGPGAYLETDGDVKVKSMDCFGNVTGQNLKESSSQGSFPFATTVNFCGEMVDVEGTFHVVSNTVVSNSGNLTVKFHINAKGRGIGQTSGAVYQWNDAINETLNLSKGESHTRNQSFMIIGQGQAPNFVGKVVLHFTVNANGELTSVVENFYVDCK